MSDIAIKVENLSKLYQLGTIGTGTLSRDLSRLYARVRGKEDPFEKIGQVNERNKKLESDFVWALKDISFEVKKGEVLGIIGRNGAGKSTLLKILSKITAPTTGKIFVDGRIASLLEVGTGFHPEMTGRENIFMNGAILGMRKWEIKNKFDEIVDFAGVEAYIDTPVKRYSSGMYVRLAFAVAAFLEPEILIVDEVLAVGDAEFQKKCLGRMKDVSVNDGRTVLFVSHNLGSVKELSTKGILLDNGMLKSFGNTTDIINKYAQSKISAKSFDKIQSRGPLKHNFIFKILKINEINPFDSDVFIKPDQDIEVSLTLSCINFPNPFKVVIGLICEGIRLISLTDNSEYIHTEGDFNTKIRIDSYLLRPGIYQLGIGVRSENGEWVWIEDASFFEVLKIWDNNLNKLNTGLINIRESDQNRRVQIK